MSVKPISLRDQRNRAVAECQRLLARLDAAERERDELRALLHIERAHKNAAPF